MALVWVGAGFLAFLTATTLAIDVGMFMVARTQAQNAADSGALAGATALVYNSFTDRSSSGPAVTSAVNAAQSNQVIAQAPSVGPADVTFPLDSYDGQNDLVQVSVYRTRQRNNPLSTLMGQYFGVANADVSATATAQAAPANAETCVLPFTVPDKWIEKVDATCSPDGPWWTGAEFTIATTQGNNQNQGTPCSNPDVYIAPGSANSTGYNPVTDLGLELTLKTNNQTKVAPSIYNPWDLPGSMGGSDYSNNIATCNTNIIQMGDNMTPETGNMVGPTQSGVNQLIARDPGAQWDTSCNCVKGSAFPSSPRIGIVPLYNPLLYAQDQQTGKSHPQLVVVNYLGFFIENVNGGGDVMGRITPVGGLIRGNGGPATGAFPRVIRLVQ
jgi:hypothetical protein